MAVLEEDKMVPDYDLSRLQTWQADLWLYLQVDAVLSQILADQAKRPKSPRWQGPYPSPESSKAAEDTK